MWRFFLISIALLSKTCAENKTNFLILFADDLGYGDLSCYGHPTSTTPNLDKLATEGLRFLDFYSTSPVCSPSRASLLTGRYQTRSGIYPGVFGATSIGGLPLNETTIAEYLKEAGYSTGMVGKWHLGVGSDNAYIPGNHGFESYVGIPYTHADCPCVSCFYPDVECTGSCHEPSRSEEVGCPIYSNFSICLQPADLLTIDKLYNDAAKNFMQAQKAAGRPFFLYYAFHHTHIPQYAGKEFTNSTIRGTFGDSLAALDNGVGFVMQALKDLGLDQNTLVFFSSDNGPQLSDNTHGGNQGLLKCGKGTNYEGGQRVPGIAWWPGKITPGKTREIASTLDLLPTLLKLAGVEPKKDVVLDGYDMSPILFDNRPSERDTFYYYSGKCKEEDGVYAVRYKQYKAHFITEGSHCKEPYPDHDCWNSAEKSVHDPPLLFDLDKDPSEVYALTSTDPEYNDILDTMKKLKQTFDAKMVWGKSQMERGKDEKLEPCAKPGCSPFASCCKTSQDTCPTSLHLVK
jgi:arylsulfatase A